MTKRTRSPRITDSASGVKSSKAATETRNGFDPDDHFTLREHPRNQAARDRASAHAYKTGHYILDLMADFDEGDICDGLCCYGCDWMTLFPFLGKWDKRIREFRKNPNRDRELATKLETRERMTNPNAPTLTCSEVVERLRNECLVPVRGIGGILAGTTLDRTKATAILHSWRERRVQELEEALRVLIQEMSDHREFCNDCGDALKVAEHALNSEWREQIRKGAKHES